MMPNFLDCVWFSLALFILSLALGVLRISSMIVSLFADGAKAVEEEKLVSRTIPTGGSSTAPASRVRPGQGGSGTMPAPSKEA